jgi:hypothetical protein
MWNSSNFTSLATKAAHVMRALWCGAQWNPPQLRHEQIWKNTWLNGRTNFSLCGVNPILMGQIPDAHFALRDAASTAARSWTRKISCRNLPSNHGELRRITQKKHDTIIYNPSKYLMPPKILVWSWICSFCRPHKGGLLILGACSAPKMDDQLEKFTEKMSRSLKWRVNHQRLQPQYGRFDYWVPTRVAINDRMTQYARSFPWVFDHPHLGTPMTWARRGAGSDDVDFETFDKAWEMRGATGEKHPPAHRHTFVYIFSYIYDMIYIYIYTIYI